MKTGVNKLSKKTKITNYLTNDSLDIDTQGFMSFVTKLLKLKEDDEDNGSDGFTMDDLLKMIKFLYEKKGVNNFENLVKMAKFKGIFANNPKHATKFLNNIVGLMVKSNFNLAEYDKLRIQKLNKCIKGNGNLIDALFEKIKAKVILFKNAKTKMATKVSKLEIKDLKDGIIKSFKLALKVLKFAKKISTKIANIKKLENLGTTTKEKMKGFGSRGNEKGKEREKNEKENKKENMNKLEEKKTEVEKIREDKKNDSKTEEQYKKSETSFYIDNNMNNKKTSKSDEMVNFINNEDASKFSNYEKASNEVRNSINESANQTREEMKGQSRNNEIVNDNKSNTISDDKIENKNEVAENREKVKEDSETMDNRQEQGSDEKSYNNNENKDMTNKEQNEEVNKDSNNFNDNDGKNKEKNAIEDPGNREMQFNEAEISESNTSMNDSNGLSIIVEDLSTNKNQEQKEKSGLQIW